MTKILSLDGSRTNVSEEAIEALGAGLRGEVARDGDPGYEDARIIWNAMVDRRPGLVVRARGASDVKQAVDFARENGLLVTVRSGGHQIAGHAVQDGALMIDLSQMHSVHVDADAKRARVEPGATLGDVDRETLARNLVLPMGINSTTGIAGLTLGGGFGWTTRRFGMTIDNLVSADLVTAGGDYITASKSQNSDLFWAIRGGGGNFGIVTSFEFGLHDIRPEVFAGLIVHPFDQAATLMKDYARIAGAAPDDLTVWSVMRKAPPLPFLPEEWHGREVLVFAVCYVGDPANGEEVTREIASLGKPIATVLGPQPLGAWQTAFDPLLTPGARNYWKSHDFEKLTDDSLKVVLGAVETLPDPQCEVFMAHVGGAMARVGKSETAYPHRSSHFIMNVHGRWDDPAKDQTCIGWARKLFDAAAPYATGGVYVNFMPADEVDRVAGAYGDNLERLTAVKDKYDPDNLFRINHNIRPHAVAHAAQ